METKSKCGEKVSNFENYLLFYLKSLFIKVTHIKLIQ